VKRIKGKKPERMRLVALPNRSAWRQQGGAMFGHWVHREVKGGGSTQGNRVGKRTNRKKMGRDKFPPNPIIQQRRRCVGGGRSGKIQVKIRMGLKSEVEKTERKKDKWSE